MNSLYAVCSRRAAGGSRRWRGSVPSVGAVLAVGLVAFALHKAGLAADCTASAYLRVAANEPSVVFSHAQRPAPNEFEVYRNTQAALLKNPMVLVSALRNPEVRKLKLEERVTDPEQWLAEHLRVAFPDNAEIMQVSVAGKDPAEAALLVNAVVDAYLKDIVYAEKNAKRSRLNDLEKKYGELITNVRAKMNELKNLATALGTSNDKDRSLKQQVAMEDHAQYRRALITTQIDRRRLETELKARKEMMRSVADMEIPPFEVEVASHDDPMGSQVLFPLLLQAKRQLLEAQVLAAKPDAEQIARLQKAVEDVKGQIASYEKAVAEGVRNKRLAEIERERLRLEISALAATQLEQELGAEVDNKRKQAEKLAESSVDFEMARTELVRLQTVMSEVAHETAKVRIEIDVPPRVTLLRQADPPRK